mmetsp:Transcript_70854/g.117717  ORF Transcript_70854/g.117717 Transcript_70854/m.117717 type:complete len:210 (+) Transcript_70854:163-792(+)
MHRIDHCVGHGHTLQFNFNDHTSTRDPRSGLDRHTCYALQEPRLTNGPRCESSNTDAHLWTSLRSVIWLRAVRGGRQHATAAATLAVVDQEWVMNEGAGGPILALTLRKKLANSAEMIVIRRFDGWAACSLQEDCFLGLQILLRFWLLQIQRLQGQRLVRPLLPLRLLDVLPLPEQRVMDEGASGPILAPTLSIKLALSAKHAAFACAS